MSVSPDTVPGVDDGDRVQPLESPLAFARRRVDGRFQIDAFGGDAQLMDLAGLVLTFGVRVEVEHAERIPRIGGALIVANRGLGILEPAALGVAVRLAVGRRLRIIGGPGPLPIRPWRVVVGPVVETVTDAVPGDTLAGAELAERTRTAVNQLLEVARRPD